MEGRTNKLTLAEIDQRITRSAVEAVIEIGYYLKQIRDRKLYLEAGCKDVYEYAEKQYGYSQSTTSRNMNRNDRFSVGGNSPKLAEEYRLYSKSQLQEMLSLEDGQLKEVKPDMTVKQIREMKPKRKKTVSEEQAIENTVHRFKDDLEAYGWSWNETVKEYLKKGYESNENETEIEVLGKAVVVLKQDDITVFMGKGGPVLFEVENARLAKEFEFYSKQNPPVATSHKNLAAETQQKEQERCENAAEPVEEEMYTPQYFLEEQKARLNEILALGEDEVKSLPRKMVERQKTIVAALAAMVCDLEELEKSEQPELPVFKNNDQRKAFIDSYMDWPIWIETKQTGERYYRYDLHNGVSFVVKVYYHKCFDYRLPAGTKYEDRFKPGFGSEEYYLVMEEKFFKDCRVSKSTLIDYLKGVQKK